MLRVQTICLVILTLIAGGFALHYLQTVLLPFVIAFFVVSGCRPILDYLENRFGLHWILSFAITFGLGVFLLAGFSFLTWLSINDLATHFDKYKVQVDKMATSISQFFEESGASLSQSAIAIGANVAPAEKEDADQPETTETPNDRDANNEAAEQNQNENSPDEEKQDSDLVGDESGDTQTETDDTESQESINELIKFLTDQQEKRKKQQSAIPLTQLPETDPNIFSDPKRATERMFQSLGEYVQGLILGLAGTLTSLLSSAILILIYVFFLLLGRAEATGTRAPIVKAIDDQIRKYILMKTVISAFTGLATWMVLAWFQVPLAIVFGLLTFLINFIPNIGPVVISMLPVPLLFLSDKSPVEGLLIFFLVAAIQFISGNIVETRVMGKSFDVNPVVLLLSLMFFGLIWGIPGMFLATPIVSVVKIVLQERESTRPFADMLAGKWNGGGLGSGNGT